VDVIVGAPAMMPVMAGSAQGGRCAVLCYAVQVLPPGSELVSIEKDLSWWLVAKRFLWQASQGQKNKDRDVPLGNKVCIIPA